MTTATSNQSIIAPGEEYMTSGAMSGNGLGSEQWIIEKHRAAWNEIIDHKLIEWGRNPEALEDDECEPPTKIAIQMAIEEARLRSDKGDVHPTRVVPDGDGGLAFEFIRGDVVKSMEFRSDGSRAYVACQGGRMIEFEESGLLT